MNNLLIGGLAILALGVIGTMSLGVFQSEQRTTGVLKPNDVAVTLYKSPACGCCGEYAAHIEREGYAVSIEKEQDMSSVKERYGVPYELESCHTMEVGGYIVEGHVPHAAIDKLLTERPDIKGIGLAGMPSGSPGMPGPKTEEFVVYEITHEGTKGDVFVTI